MTPAEAALWTSAAGEAARLLNTDRRHVALVEPDARSGITVFSVFRDQRQDKASIGSLRVSTHFFNDEEDVDRLVSAVARAMRTR